MLLNFAVHAVIAIPLVLAADRRAVTPKVIAGALPVGLTMLNQSWSHRLGHPDSPWAETFSFAFFTGGLWTALAAAATLVVLHLWKPETAT